MFTYFEVIPGCRSPVIFSPCVQHLDFVDDDAVHLDPPRYSLRTSVLSNATPDIVKGTKGTLQLLIISSACTASSL